jgi:D-glycerate 3-kinase
MACLLKPSNWVVDIVNDPNQRLDLLLSNLLKPGIDRSFDPSSVLSELETLLLADQSFAQTFGITAENSRVVVEQQSLLFQALYPILDSFCCSTLGWKKCPLAIAWTLWLPLAMQLAEQRSHLNRPLIQGILGGQGTGKSTLAAILVLILNHLGYHVCRLSLDDLYKTYDERLQLQQADPRLKWRGPPGTHDIALGLQVLQQLQSGRSKPIALPRFDKSAQAGAGDRTTPEIVQNIDIVLFEGWFVGVRPINPAYFETAPPPIDTDSDRQFARDMNQYLQAYLPLWDLLDRLIVLYPVDYRLSQQWRQQAEQQMKTNGRTGMSDAEINQFVEYFWRSLHPELFILPLLHNAKQVDLVIEINPDHSPSRIYCPQTDSPD